MRGKRGCFVGERGLLCGEGMGFEERKWFALRGESWLFRGRKWFALREENRAVLWEESGLLWGWKAGSFGEKEGLFGEKVVCFEGNSLVYSWGKFLYWTWQ